MQKLNKQGGFTLMEIMIVVCIIGIISAIAYPNYIEQIRKSRRVDAKIKLQEFAQLQESFFSRQFTYAPDLSTLLGGGMDTVNSDEDYYLLSVSAAAGLGGVACTGTRASPCTTYTLQAIPQTGTTQAHDSNCSLFSLDNMGRRASNNAATVSIDTTARCW